MPTLMLSLSLPLLAVPLVLGISESDVTTGLFGAMGVAGLIGLIWRLIRDSRTDTDQKSLYRVMLSDANDVIERLSEDLRYEQDLNAAYRSHYGALPTSVRQEYGVLVPPTMRRNRGPHPQGER